MEKSFTVIGKLLKANWGLIFYFFLGNYMGGKKDNINYLVELNSVKKKAKYFIYDKTFKMPS